MILTKSMNKISIEILSNALEKEKELKIKTISIRGATIVDMGIKTQGSVEAGLITSLICLGGLASLSLSSFYIDNILLPAIEISTDHPIEACLASQLAGWRIQIKDFFANGSGPARILAKKPKKLFELIGYSESSEEAIIVLETNQYPSEEAIAYIANEAKVQPKNLYIVLVSPSSIAGSIQVSARIVETGIFKMHNIGLDIRAILYGYGICPIAPLHPDPLVMAGRTNDMLLYGGSTFYLINYEDDSKLKELIEKVPSISSKDYGKSFTELVKIYGWDFLYKLDPMIFAPAAVTINNTKTGTIISAGKVNIDILRDAILKP